MQGVVNGGVPQGTRFATSLFADHLNHNSKRLCISIDIETNNTETLSS